MVFMNNCKAAKAVSGAGGRGVGGSSGGSEHTSSPLSPRSPGQGLRVSLPLRSPTCKPGGNAVVNASTA